MAKRLLYVGGGETTLSWGRNDRNSIKRRIITVIISSETNLAPSTLAIQSVRLKD